MATTSIAVADRDHWHALRAGTIGGSEIASLFYAWAMPDGAVRYLHMFEAPPEGAVCLGCVSRHTTGFRLYHQKRGRLPADDLDEVERVQAGQFLEPALAAWAAKKWPEWLGPLRKVHRYMVHPAVQGLGASRDYELHASGHPPVEFKNVDFLIFRDQWVAEGDTITAPPMDITLQVQHQMAADGGRADHGWVVACVGGNRLLRGRIDAHRPTQARIEAAVAAFWHAVNSGQEPLEVADFDTIAELYAEGGAVKPADLTADNRLPDLCARYRHINAKRKQAAKLEDAIKAQIGARMADAARATATGFAITWPVINRKARTQEIQAGTYRGALTIKEI